MDRGQEIRELKLGASFTNPNARAVFHTLKCKSDFGKFENFCFRDFCHILSFANSPDDKIFQMTLSLQVSTFTKKLLFRLDQITR